MANLIRVITKIWNPNTQPSNLWWLPNSNKQRFWQCNDSALFKTTTIIPQQHLCVSFKFASLQIKAYPTAFTLDQPWATAKGWQLETNERFWDIVWLVSISPFSWQCQKICLTSMVFGLESFEKDFGQPYDNCQSVALLFLYILNMEQRLGFLAPKIFYGLLWNVF